MNRKEIYIDFDVYKEIVKRQSSFDDEPNNILRKILGLPEKNNSSQEDSINFNNKDFMKSGTPPGLFTKEILLKNGLKLQNKSRGKVYEAEIRGGRLIYNGRAYKSLSKAGSNATGVSTNGWTFWNYFDEKNKNWVPCKALREK